MLKRQYQADNKTCKVTFTTDPGITKDAKKVAVVGNFNDWDATANPMKRRKDGSFAATVKLACGERYQFRYLIDGSLWENDAAADGYVPTPFGDCDNSVIEVQAATPSS
jgi:1,4-alpha-glucan branching enzyme